MKMKERLRKAFGFTSAVQPTQTKVIDESATQKNSLSEFIHILLLLILIWIVILFVRDNDLLLIDNYLTKTLRIIANGSIYKPMIISYAKDKYMVDIYLSSIYLIFSGLFINHYFTSKQFKKIYMIEEAFSKKDSFSGVLSIHLYSKFNPPLYFHAAYSKYASKSAVKSFDDFLIEQLDNVATKSYFIFFAGCGYLLLPALAIYLINDASIKLVNFWLVSLLMVYCQMKVIFEGVLIFFALIKKEGE